MFLISRGDLEDRLDSYFYQPEFLHLEKKIKNITSGKLRDYIINIASGATPEKEDAEKYYADRKNGIPFLRVQNVTPEGLNFENLKFINSQTHNGMLARSKVYEFDLLTKITGVGRMAVSSIVPKGFEGNINQHLVVIRTENEQTSRVLSAFLNTDIGERLASRRATGGTRPALDYKALRSIPIVFKPEIVKVMDNVIARKKQKESEAAALLASIDDYLLNELGITLPEAEENTIQNRMFKTTFSEVSAGRYDSFYYQPKYANLYEAMEKGKYKCVVLRDIITDLKNGIEIRSYKEIGRRYLRVTDLTKTGLNNQKVKYVEVEEVPEKIKLSKTDFLISRSGSLGLVSAVTNEIIDAVLSSHIFRVSLNVAEILPEYLQAYLRSCLGQFQFFQRNNGGVIPEISQGALKSIVIITPPIKKQTEIANYIQSIHKQAKQLEQEGREFLNQAKVEVERMILGNPE